MCGLITDTALLAPLFQGGGEALVPYKGSTLAGRRCDECGYVRFPAPSEQELSNYYEREWIPRSSRWFNVESDFADWKRIPLADRVLELASPFGHGLNSVFHEVGCAFGGTVFELQTRGYSASGTDKFAALVAEGQRNGVHDTSTLSPQDFFTERERKADVIYGFQMLQRERNPIAILSSLTSCLTDSGILILVVPNAMAVFPLVYGYSRYEWYSFPAHLHHFTAKSIQCLARAADLEVLSVGSRRYAVAPEFTAAAISAREDSDVAKELRDYALETALLGEELEFVLAPRASAARFPDQICIAAEKCRASGALERAQRDRATFVHLPDPWK